MALEVNTVAATEMVTECLRNVLVPFLKGSPGIGKSAIINQIAKEFNLKLIDLRLSQCDPTDLMGFPKVDPKTNKASYSPMDTFPLKGDSMPLDGDGKQMGGWLLFLDEINSAPESVQAAAYKLVLDRQVGNFDLHDKVAVVCAGNRETDNAITNRMSTALQSRLIHIEMDVDVNAWVDWANSNGIDHRITSFVKFKPELLYSFNPDHSDSTYACPRTWEFGSRQIKNTPVIEGNALKLLGGTISEGVAREFAGYCQVCHEIPTIQEIVANPLLVEIPDEPSTLYALTGSIGANGTLANIDPLMEYVSRMGAEFQVITGRALIRRNPELIQSTAIQKWIAKSAEELM